MSERLVKLLWFLEFRPLDLSLALQEGFFRKDFH